MKRPTGMAAMVLADGRRRITVETDKPRIRDIPVAGAVKLLWSKYLWYCEERACPRLSFFESIALVPGRVREGSSSAPALTIPLRRLVPQLPRPSEHTRGAEGTERHQISQQHPT